ncbi:MAG: hypothetical protein R2834_10920 [Rhodothermales bacterium]
MDITRRFTSTCLLLACATRLAAAQVGGALPPLEMKNPNAPLILSIAATAVPVLAANTFFEGTRSDTGTALMLFGAIVGPGVGYLATNQPGWLLVGLTVRGLGMGLVYAGANDIFSKSDGGGTSLVLGMVLMGASAGFDFARLKPESMRRRRLPPRSRISLAPVHVQNRVAAGLAFRTVL